MANSFNVPIDGLLALLLAESGLNEYAQRYGTYEDGSPNYADWSFGLSQFTIPTAAAYNIGDGTGSEQNVSNVQNFLWDRYNAIKYAAMYYSYKYQKARELDWTEFFNAGRIHWQNDDAYSILGLVGYNAGSIYPPYYNWWVSWAGNVASYEGNLQKAKELLGVA